MESLVCRPVHPEHAVELNRHRRGLSHLKGVVCMRVPLLGRRTFFSSEAVLAAAGLPVEPFAAETLRSVYLSYRGMVKPEGASSPFRVYSPLGSWVLGTPCTYHLGGKCPPHYPIDPALKAMKEGWDQQRKARAQGQITAAQEKPDSRFWWRTKQRAVRERWGETDYEGKEAVYL